jgi:hypothetical protein
VAEYIEPEEVERAFGIELPKKSGVSPNQPAPFYGRLSRIWQITALSVFVALLIQWNMGSGTLVTTYQIHIAQNERDKTFSTPVFNFARRSNLFVKSTVPLNNDWMELDLSLVNDASNEAYEARQAIEYYSGYDDGESWSEGGQVAESSFSSVPAGNYRLMVDPSPGQMGPNGMDVSLELKSNVGVWGNFWMIFFLIIIFPLYAFLYRWYFENKRWENSDYAPAIYRSGESDD